MAPSVARVIIAGGGPAAVEALLALRDLAGDRVSLALVAPNREFVVRAYEVLAPFHEGQEHRYPLARIAADLNAELVVDVLAAVDADAQLITLGSGEQRSYDALIVAVGARLAAPLPGAIPFRGAQDAGRLRALLGESQAGRHAPVAFVVSSGHVWALPLYEVALHTSNWLRSRGVTGVELSLVSPESAPLALFGARVSQEVAGLLEANGIDFVTGHALRLAGGQLALAGGVDLRVETAISLPRLTGPRIPGLHHDREGYLPVDAFGRVLGVERVFAAGDATAYPVKQGGIATQHSDVIAALLAAELGVPGPVSEFRPVLRAVLMGGHAPRYLYAEPGERLQQTSRASPEPLWPESSTLLGRYLAPYLESLDSASLAQRPRNGDPH
jgi:sulfide:quinone oxidoreductase